MAKELNKAQVNHLRRLLGWVRCEIPPAPEEVVKIVQDIGRRIYITKDGQEQLVGWHREATNVPMYIRAALKSLEPVVREAQGEIVDAKFPVANRKTSRRLPDNRKLKLLR